MGTIDVHTHFIPKTYLDALEQAGVSAADIGFPMKQWHESERVDVMDQNGIEVEALSLSSPGLRYWHGKAAASLARTLNDELADIVRNRPTRFAALATLPLPDVDASLAEIAYAFDQLHADGVVLMTNYGSRYLGHPDFAPVLDELNRRGATVFVHPTEGPANEVLVQGYPAPAFEYPAASTRMVVSLIDSDTVARCPDLKIVVSHGGGMIPFIKPRLGVLLPWKWGGDADAGKARVDGAIDSLYFDLAIVSYPASLSAIALTHDPAKLVVGYDLPFFPAKEIGTAVANLAAFDGFSDTEREMINSGNARRLFSRLSDLSVAAA